MKEHLRTTEPVWMRVLLTTIALAFLGVFVALPVFVMFSEALAKGINAYAGALIEENARAAIHLTLLVAAIAVPCNLVFGVAASWAITKFDFVGKQFLVTLIDLPFS